MLVKLIHVSKGAPVINEHWSVRLYHYVFQYVFNRVGECSISTSYSEDASPLQYTFTFNTTLKQPTTWVCAAIQGKAEDWSKDFVKKREVTPVTAMNLTFFCSKPLIHLTSVV